MQAFKTKTVCLVALCLFIGDNSAQAYFYPGGYGNFVPGLMSFLPYYGFSFLNRGPYSAYPLYTLQNSLYRASTRALASPYNYNYTGYALQNPSNYPYSAETYYDPEPLYQPRQRTRPVRSGLYGVDENTHATWSNGKPNNTLTAQAQQNYFTDPFQDQGQIQSQPQMQGSQFNLQPYTPPGEMPPLAPQVVTKGAGRSAISMDTPQAPTGAPLARGFVAKINEQFDGDISRALFDPSMRGWARCLSLVQDEDIIKLDLSTARVALIRQVFKDEGLDDISKLDAVKVLLRGSAKRASE